MRVDFMAEGKGGFTLAELLVSCGIMTILLAAAYTLWQTGLGLWQRESDVLAIQQEGRIVLEMVAREVRRARADSVEIMPDGGSDRRALQFLVDEGEDTQAKISYLQDGAQLIRRKNKGDGAGTNVYLTKLSRQNGFSVSFVNTSTGSRRRDAGSRLAENEVIELTLRCQRITGDYTVQTRVTPRN